MADKSFEQRVREELGSLKMRPDEAVWATVQAGIRKDRKRRWMVWLLLFAALGGGALWYTLEGFDAGEKSQATTMQQAGNQERTDQEKNTRRGRGEQQEGNDSGVNPKRTAETESGKQEIREDGSGTLTGKTTINQASKKIIIGDDILASIKEKQRKQFAQQKVEAAFKNKRLQTLTNVSQPGGLQDRMQGSGQSTLVEQKQETNLAKTGVAPRNSDQPPPQNESPSQPLTIKTDIDSPAPKPEINVQTLNDTAASLQFNQSKTESKWRFSIAAAIGSSGLVKGLFAGEPLQNAGNLNPNPPVTAPGNGGVAGNNGAAPAVRNAPGYGFRLNASRAVGKNLNIDIFAGYSLLQTAVKTGSRYNSAAAFSSGFYYANTDSVTYNNRYHFLSLGAEFTRALKLFNTPAKWRFGGGVNYLVSSNGLHFDNSTGVLYKNNALLRKIQPFLSTGIDLAIGERLYIGPHLQYQLRSVTSASVDHLWFGALQLSFALPRKK